jgi:hypothetical protein
MFLAPISLAANLFAWAELELRIPHRTDGWVRSLNFILVEQIAFAPDVQGSSRQNQDINRSGHFSAQ